MARITITVDDALAAAVAEAATSAGRSISDYYGRAARRTLLADEARALAAWQAAHPAEAAESYAETEAAAEQRDAAERRHRGAA